MNASADLACVECNVDEYVLVSIAVIVDGCRCGSGGVMSVGVDRVDEDAVQRRTHLRFLSMFAMHVLTAWGNREQQRFAFTIVCILLLCWSRSLESLGLEIYSSSIRKKEPKSKYQQPITFRGGLIESLLQLHGITAFLEMRAQLPGNLEVFAGDVIHEVGHWVDFLLLEDANPFIVATHNVLHILQQNLE